MAKFRYYISSVFTGTITGTNDSELAKEISLNEDDFVVDTETGKWLTSDKEEHEIEATSLTMEDMKDENADAG